MDKVECVVIGAGVIGLAVARRLAQAGREVIVLEAAEAIGLEVGRLGQVMHQQHVFGRNRGVGFKLEAPVPIWRRYATI